MKKGSTISKSRIDKDDIVRGGKKPTQEDYSLSAANYMDWKSYAKALELYYNH